jgi:hypothetical protein
MNQHLVCLTVDTDPDGLSGVITNRRTLDWDGLAYISRLPHDLSTHACFQDLEMPITWLVRIDGQLRRAFGTSLWVLESFASFWDEVQRAGHELGWHPHLYRQPTACSPPELITNETEAAEELRTIWSELTLAGFEPRCFRNGEGWHTPGTYATVEQFGVGCDSTVIPGRGGAPDHPMDWRGAPNEPYFPDSQDIRHRGAMRSMLELPVATWMLQAPYDIAPRRRYINPAVHEALFSNAVQNCEVEHRPTQRPRVWVLLLHPDDASVTAPQDALYARSTRVVARNLAAFRARLESCEGSVEFVTLSEAARRWSSAMGWEA